MSCLQRLVMAAVLRRNLFFLRLFGILVAATLLTSYLIFVQVNDEDPKTRIAQERLHKNIDMPTDLPPITERSLRKSRRIGTSAQKKIPSLMLFRRGDYSLRKNGVGRPSFRRSSEQVDNVVALPRAKKSRFSVIRDAFRSHKRARRTVNVATLTGHKTRNGKKSKLSINGDVFRDNIEVHRTVTKQLEPKFRVTPTTYVIKPASVANHQSTVRRGSFLDHNISPRRTVNNQLEDRSVTITRGTKKPSLSSHDNSPTIGKSLLRQSTSAPQRTVDKKLEIASKTEMADVEKKDSAPPVNRDVFRHHTSAHRTVKTHLEATSVTTIATSTHRTTSQVKDEAFRQNIREVKTSNKQLEARSQEVNKPSSTLRANQAATAYPVDSTSRPRTATVQPVVEQTVRKPQRSDFTVPRRNVIIVAEPRTGSSFLGDAFNQNPDIFYLFEPLRGVMNHPLQYINDPRPMQFLAGILRCKFTSPTYVKEIEKFRRFSSNALSSPPLCATKTSLYTPKKKCNALSTRNMEHVCKLDYRVTVMKILTSRIPRNKVESLFPLCNTTNCTIIYLVRDPRPVIFSHMKVGIQTWQNFKIRANSNAPRPSVRMYSAHLCRQIEANVKAFMNFTGKMNNRYHMLRYEDLARNPVETLQRAFKIGGVTMQNNTLQWIKNHTLVRKLNLKDERNDFSTNRNSKALIDKWRLEVDPCLVNIIEDSCRSVMRLLGYKPLNRSEKMQYNLTVSLYDDNVITRV